MDGFNRIGNEVFIYRNSNRSQTEVRKIRKDKDGEYFIFLRKKYRITQATND